MVANCASSRGHIGLTAAALGGGGGAPGFDLRAGVSAEHGRAEQRSAGQNPSGEGGVNVSGISGH